MFKTTLIALSLPLLLSATAVAQTTTVQPSKNCPAAGTVAESAMPPECKTVTPSSGSNTTSTTPSTTTSTTTTQSTPTPSSPAPSTTATTTTPSTSTTAPTAANVSPSNSVLASEFMGQTVYNINGDSIGKINDLVMTRNLDNVLSIIGVGGFLGIGEKDVAIPISQIKVDKDGKGNMRLTVNNTKAQLEAAPTFDRTALK